MAALVNPIENLRYECRGAFHTHTLSPYQYDPRCQSCQMEHGHPFDLHDPAAVAAWLGDGK